MKLFVSLTIVCFAIAVFAEENSEEQPTTEATTTEAPKAWKLREGDICSLKRHPLPSYKPDEFFECLKPTNDDKHWPWEDIGIWMIRKCQPGRAFSVAERTCRRLETIRKLQQSICQTNPSYCNVAVLPTIQQPVYPQVQTGCNTVTGCPQPQPQPCVNQPCQVIQPQPVIVTPRPYVPQPYVQPYVPQPQPYVQPYVPQPQPCQVVQPTVPNQPAVVQPNNCQPQVVAMPCAKAGQGGASTGGFCSWMMDPLRPGPQPNQYYQCVPASALDPYCGQWKIMPCPCGTKFDQNLQVCVRDSATAQNCPQAQGCGVQPQPTPFQPYVQPTVPCQPTPVQPVYPQPQPVYTRQPQPIYPQPQPTAIVQPSCVSGTVPIAGCNTYNQCPGFSTCNQGTCCQPTYG